MGSDHRSEGDELSDSAEAGLEASDQVITIKSVLSAVLAGAVGLVLMTPIMVGIPQALGVFRTDPIIDFAWLGMTLGFQPNLASGLLLFGVGGAVVLPLLFVVAGAFLPPHTPRFARGVTFATITWTGFVLAFWPGGSPITVGLFLFFSLLSHWVYGLTLGVILDRLVGIPQHDV